MPAPGPARWQAKASCDEVTLATNDAGKASYELRDPDVRLMLEVREDNAAAFEELVLRYQNRLVAVLEHLTGKRDQAEDLAQEVFMRVYRARKKYVPTAKFSTWLFTIANNVASNARRSNSRRREVHLEPAAGTTTQVHRIDQMLQVSSGQIPARQLDKAEMRDIVRAALSSLNERQRMALLLNKFEDMSYADIATIMEMSPQAIKSLLSRARGSMKDVLEPYLDQGSRPKVR